MSEPIIITNIQELQKIANDPTAGYVLGANIDAADFHFTPISKFSGVLDGQGYSIENLTVIGSNAGLFGKILPNGTVRNFALNNVTISGTDVGSLARENDGLVQSISVSGEVSGDAQHAVGGLVGQNFGQIESCHSSVYIRSNGNYSGGLVGVNLSTGHISSSSFTGTVYGFFSSYSTHSVGGLVGDNAGTISQSFSTADVRGSDDVGGLVGFTGGQISDCYATGDVSGGYFVGALAGVNGGTIETSYATGLVPGGTYVGGLVGYALSVGGTETNSYWDMKTTGQQHNSGGGVGETTVQLQSGVLPGGFDPAIWGAESENLPISFRQSPAS